VRACLEFWGARCCCVVKLIGRSRTWPAWG
jgi:hypothetical protein